RSPLPYTSLFLAHDASGRPGLGPRARAPVHRTGPAAGACRQDLLKLLRVHGLDEVNVEAGGPRPLEVVRLTVARHRDEPRPGNVGADAPGDLVTVDARQADVDQRDVGPEAPRPVHARLTVARLVPPV